MPYAIGVLKSNARVRIPDYACVVDLDAGTVVDPDDGPLVGGDAIRALEKLIEVGISLPPHGGNGAAARSAANARYAEAVRDHKGEFASFRSYLHCPRKVLFTEGQAAEIAAVFAEMLAPPLEALASLCFVTDCTECCPVTVFNRGLFCSAVGQGQAAFYKAFMQTTMFQEFIDRKMDEKSREVASLLIL
jgi:hypothetical protein